MTTALPSRRPRATRRIGGRATALAGAALVVLAACSSTPAAAPSSTSPASSAAPSAGTTAGASGSATGAGTASCDYVPTGDAAKDVGVPEAQQPTTPPVTAELTLPGGALTISLDRAETPCTVGSFTFLAKAGYFDGTTCHRLTSSASLKVLQCGDPTGTGRGGPGYSFADETSPDMTYPAGTVAMANAGPDTNGSQFFLVYGDSTLPPNYTVFGQITGGEAALDAIAQAGANGGGPDGLPAADATISSVTIS
ncbi:peptidyl-prolyl cis-trans isomerase B (cyclophilin B) [Nakamurella flavida]|uniref:peptidylprolyl isomerase n=1 Tax=Nakamurella flavida TaxID=363630 RepID=UPI002781B2F6|nr:peptidylprolyl isomerase [Nakamurella flavida]MDP9780068.1 peptidyl-prolyl cis-trans isomerase B (cyclophilin B) [Nakamurella flavida]